MKISKQSKTGKNHLARGLILAAALAGTTLGWRASAAIVAADSSTPGAIVIRGTDSSGAPSNLSSGVSDVLKMVQAKVDPEVIKTYVKNSPIAYNPSATEVISLKEHGVSDDIVTALMQRGGELRAQAARTAQAAPAPAAPPAYPGAANPYAPAPAYDYGTAPYYPENGYDYGAYPYAYPYAYPGYSYPYYSYWPYYWPFYSSFFFGFGHGFHDHFHHHHFDHFGHHFHDGFNHFGSGFGVHRPGTFAGRSGAFRTGFSGRTAPVAGRPAGMMSVGFRSGGFAGRPAPFAGRPGGMMSAGFRSGGFGGHAAMGGMRAGGMGGMRGGGGFGGHAMGRGR